MKLWLLGMISSANYSSFMKPYPSHPKVSKWNDLDLEIYSPHMKLHFLTFSMDNALCLHWTQFSGLSGFWIMSYNIFTLRQEIVDDNQNKTYSSSVSHKHLTNNQGFIKMCSVTYSTISENIWTIGMTFSTSESFYYETVLKSL